jgi:hypothetical protein
MPIQKRPFGLGQFRQSIRAGRWELDEFGLTELLDQFGAIA